MCSVCFVLFFNLIINKIEEPKEWNLVWGRLRNRREVGKIIFKYLLDHDVRKRLELFCLV